MKKILLLLALMIVSISVSAQIYDGKLPGTTWRALLPVQTTLESGDGTHVLGSSPQLMYKQEVTDWLAVEGVVSYNMANETISPKVWFGLNPIKNVWLIQRNNYDAKTKKYSTGVSGTWKVKNFGVDATWDNIYNNDEWLGKDRLQVVGTIATNDGKWNFNAGYSCRFKKGFVANARYNIQNGIRLQSKLDTGAKTISAMFIWDFN